MHDLMLKQSELGHDVFAVAHHHEVGQKYVEFNSAGVTVSLIPILGKKVFVPISPSFYSHVKRIVKQCSPDVIHIHMPNVSSFPLLFSKEFHGIPWVVHWHSDVLGAAPDWRVKLLYPFYRFFEKRVLQKASKVIVTSPPYLASSSPLKEVTNKCEVIPLGLTDVRTSFTKTAEDSKCTRLLCIGRLTYYKGHRYLLEAMSILKDYDINLDIVGSGELGPSLKQYSVDLGVTQKVNFLGKVSNSRLEKLLQESDLVCLPSIEKTEAFGLVLLEAMRVGKPCLVTDVVGSGMSWVVVNNETGVVVSHSNKVALAESILNCHYNHKLFEQLGRNGRSRFLSHFDINQVAKKTIDLYRKLLQ